MSSSDMSYGAILNPIRPQVKEKCVGLRMGHGTGNEARQAWTNRIQWRIGLPRRLFLLQHDNAVGSIPVYGERGAGDRP